MLLFFQIGSFQLKLKSLVRWLRNDDYEVDLIDEF